MILLQKVLFLKNTALLTATAVILRLGGVIVKVWLAARLGSRGMGVYSLLFSFYAFAAAIVGSGISTAVTRVLSENEISKSSAQKTVNKGIYIGIFSALSQVVFIIPLSKIIAAFLFGDALLAPAVRATAFSLPFMGFSSAVRGYFVARKKALPLSISSIAEQAVRICLIFVAVSKFSHMGAPFLCCVVFMCDAAAEATCAVVLFAFYRINLSVLPKAESTHGGKLLRIALPVNLSRYINSLLRAAENMLVPKMLIKGGMDTGRALGVLGNIKGMALPVLLFPAAILNAVSTLLVPEISSAKAKGQTGIVKSEVIKVYKITAQIGLLCAAVFFAAGRQIGLAVYKSEDAGRLITVLSPLVPLMYLDSVCDGLIKGLDCQAAAFKYTVSDSLLRIILVVILLPVLGVKGFIIIMYISNIFTCSLNMFKLFKTVNIKKRTLFSLVLPTVFSFLPCFCLGQLFCALNVNGIAYILLVAATGGGAYVVLLEALKISAVPLNNFKRLKKVRRV